MMPTAQRHLGELAAYRVDVGMTTCSWEPSGIVASTNGVLMSIRRPAAAASIDERPAGLDEPDLLNRRIVEIARQRPEPGHPVQHIPDDRSGSPTAVAPWSAKFRSSRRRRRAPAPDRPRNGERIQPSTPDELADLAVHDIQSGRRSTPVEPGRSATNQRGLQDNE